MLTILFSILLTIRPIFGSFVPGTERWITEELGSVKALHHNEMSQLFSPVAEWREHHFFFVYTTPDLVVRVAHYQEGFGGAAIRIRDEPLVDECYKRSASWKHDFSLGVDELGYLHVAGDMDEYPYYEQSRHGHLPPELKGHNCLFWRSVRPGDSRAFVFVGHLDGGEGCPIGDGFSRLRFTNDRNGRLFAHYGNLAYVGARNDTDGRLGDRGLGMSRYDPYQKKWILIGRSWRSDWGEMSRTALNVDEQNVNGPFQESYRDVVFDRHGVAHLCSVTRYLTREYVTYALSDATDYNTWETRHRDSLSLPITTAPPAEIIADLGHGYEQFGPQVSFAQLPSRDVDDVLAFVREQNVNGTLLLRGIDSSTGAWRDVAGPEFPQGHHLNLNNILYGPDDIPTMLSKEGIYRFSSATNVQFSPVPHSRLQPAPGYFLRTGKLLSVSLSEKAEPLPHGSNPVASLKLLMTRQMDFHDDEQWVLKEIDRVSTAKRATTQFFSPLASWGENDYVYTYVSTLRNVRIRHVRNNEDDELEVVDDVLLEDQSYKTVGDSNHAYSIGVDEKGYIFLAGDMDEYPEFGSRHEHLPPDFRDKKCLFWKSTSPRDVKTLAFVGDEDAAEEGKHCPWGTGYSRLRFINDQKGRLYAHYRAIGAISDPDHANGPRGDRGMMMSRYDADEEKWISLGGRYQPTKSASSHWALYIEPDDTEEEYGEIHRDVHFDMDDVLHIAVQLRKDVGGEKRMFLCYIRSYDYGDTWTTTDGQTRTAPMLVDDGERVAYIQQSSAGSQIAVASLSDNKTAVFINALNNWNLYTTLNSGSGTWQRTELLSWNPPTSDDGEQNFVYYDRAHGWPMMISEDGLYRFSTTESADFKSSLALQSYMFPLKASQLVVNQAHIGRTGVIAALATRFPDPGPVAKQSEPLACPLEDPDEPLAMAPMALVLIGHFPTDRPSTEEPPELTTAEPPEPPPTRPPTEEPEETTQGEAEGPTTIPPPLSQPQCLRRRIRKATTTG
eukprot:Polyplicarium_translucidae@DN2880_c0_g1_i2.p1